MKYSEETIQRIIELHQSGKGVTEIGRILNIDRAAVSRNLKKLGYNTSRNPLFKNIFHIIDSEEKAYWLGFYMLMDIFPNTTKLRLVYHQKTKNI